METLSQAVTTQYDIIHRVSLLVQL